MHRREIILLDLDEVQMYCREGEKSDRIIAPVISSLFLIEKGELSDTAKTSCSPFSYSSK